MCGGLEQHDVVELEALGERRRHDVDPSPRCRRRRRAWRARRRRRVRAACRLRHQASGTISPIDPACVEQPHDGLGGRVGIGSVDAARSSSSPRARRTDVGLVSVGAIDRQQPGGVVDHVARARGSRGSAPRGGRPACRGGSGRPAQAPTPHGVVAWARSPRTVAEPVEHCRPTERSIIGDRSCASSSTTWPRLGVRSSRSGASSISTASCSDQRRTAGPLGRLRPAQSLLAPRR